MKTSTPTLAAAALDRVRESATRFADDSPRPSRLGGPGVYLPGLLRADERKSIAPLSHRVRLPEGLTSNDPGQALPQFVNPSPWDEPAALQRYRAHLAQTFASPEGIFRFDDVSFPDQGTHSVGVQRPYCGALGKKPTARPPSPFTPPARAVTPPSTCNGTGPTPGGATRRVWTRPVFPTVCGGCGPNRRSPWSCSTGGAARGCPVVRWWPTPATVCPRWAGGPGRVGLELQRGRDRGTSRVPRATPVDSTGRAVARASPDPTPVGPEQPSAGAAERPRGAGARASGDAAGGDQEEAVGALRGGAGVARSRWGDRRLCGCQARVAVARETGRRTVDVRGLNRPAGTSCIAAVRLGRSRGPVAQGCQQLKEELGLDHFEGRSWRGSITPRR